MKAYSWLAAALLVCGAQHVSANNWDNCDPCYDPCEDSCFGDYDFSVSADYLYWKALRSDLNFENFDTHYVKPDYHSGWRVGARVGKDCWDLGVRYTSFDADTSKTVDSIKASHDFDFDVVDIELGYRWALDCAQVTFRPFVGAKLAWIDESFKVDGNKDSLDYHGYGLYLGSEASWLMWNWCDVDVSFVTRGSVAIMDGEFEAKPYDESREDERLYTPVLELFAGLDFALTNLCGFDTNVLLGYEVQSWPAWREFDSFDDLASLGLGGLTLRFNVGF